MLDREGMTGSRLSSELSIWVSQISVQHSNHYPMLPLQACPSGASMSLIGSLSYRGGREGIVFTTVTMATAGSREGEKLSLASIVCLFQDFYSLDQKESLIGA